MNFIKSKAQKTWIRTLLILISILLLAVAVLTTWMISSFAKETIRLNYNMTSVIQESIDSRLKEVENISTQVELNATNLMISKMDHKVDISASLTYQFSNQIRNYKLANHFIDAIYIYYPAIDYVVGDVGSFSSKNYYLLYNQLSYHGYDQWISKLKKQQEKNFYFRNNSLMFSRQLPYNDFEGKTAVIIIKIKRNEILKMLEKTKGVDTEAVTAVLTSDNNLYAAAGKDADETLKVLPKDRFSGEALTTYKNRYILKRDSAVSGMKYVTVVNRSKLLSWAYQIRNIAYLVLFGCLMFGVCISFYVSKKNNQPLFSIINKVKENSEGLIAAPANMIDEYNLIASKIDAMLDESTKSSLRLEEQQEKIESLFLSNVLSLEQRNSHVIFAVMQQLNLEFLYPQFEVMIIRIAGNSNISVKADDLQSFIKQLHEKYKEIYFISAEYQEDMVLLFNVGNEVTLKVLEGIALDFQSLLSAVQSSITVLGGIYDSLSDIVKSYQQAHKIADLNQNALGGVFVYDTKALKAISDEKYASNIMAEFNRYMDEQNYDEILKLIDVLFNQYVVMDSSTYLSVCKKYAVVNRVIEAAKTVALQNQTMDVEYCVELLSGSNTLAELRKAVYKVMGIIRDKYSQSNSYQVISLVQRAIDIIKKEYTNPMLGLYSISEQLGVSNSYLSTLFKDTYGQGLVQYINQMRVEKAKELILTTPLNVKEIAVRVGFASDVSFIRVFKQYSDITPGKYKGKIQDKAQSH